VKGVGGNGNGTNPIDLPLDGLSILHHSNINLTILVLFACSRRGLLIPLLVLMGEVLADDEQREGGNDRANGDNSERDPIPWLVFRLPDERSDTVANGIADKDHGVDCDALCVAGCRHSDQREEDDEWDDAPDWRKFNVNGEQSLEMGRRTRNPVTEQKGDFVGAGREASKQSGPNDHRHVTQHGSPDSTISPTRSYRYTDVNRNNCKKSRSTS
jgi:hypothetical protein